MFIKLVKGSLIVGAVGAIATAVGAYLFSLDDDELGVPEEPLRDVLPGDMVQWDCGGTLIFPEPKTVTRIEKSDMGTYVFVEGSLSGIPIHQIVPMS